MSPLNFSNFARRILLGAKLERTLVKHLYLLLLVPLFFIAYSLSDPGISITGDFPYQDTPDYAINKLWLWIERGSRDGFETLSRIPINGLWYLLSFVNVHSPFASKVLIVLGFFLSSFSFYFSFLLFFKGRLTYSDFTLKLSAILGSLFYAYNVWAFNRIHHWYLWIGYSLFPLFFVSIIYSFKEPKNWKFIASAIFLWSLASTTPHMVIYYGAILIFIFLYFFVNALIKKKESKIHLIIPLISIILFYSLVNMYWIYPFILYSQYQLLVPSYEYTENNVELLSRESNFVNTFRIMGYWLNSNVELPPEDSPLYYVLLFSSFVIPIFAFSALFLKKSIKYAIIFSSIALIALIFAMGTQSPLNYHKLAITTPVLSKFVWLLRDADKLSFLIVFAYSFLLGIVSSHVYSVLIKERNNDKKHFIIAGLFLLLILGSIYLSYPFYNDNMKPLKPIVLPTEFDRLNAYLSTVNTDKVYFMPYPLELTAWHRNGYVGSIYQTHSIKPSIGTGNEAITNNYYNFLVNSIVENRSRNFANLIYPLGTSYVIFHNDTWTKWRNSYNTDNMDLLRKLYSLEDLKNIGNIGFYKIFKATNDATNHLVNQTNIPSQNFAVLGGLDTDTSLNALPSFNTLQSSILFLDDLGARIINTSSKIFDKLILDRSFTHDEFLLSFIEDKYVTAPIDATNIHDPSRVWSKSGSSDPNGGEFHPYLRDLGIDNWDFDYGKGLVITKAAGAKLSIPFKVEDTGNHDIFFRYMKSQKGGQIKIDLDGKLMKEIDTYSKISNHFIWEKVGSVNLTKGKHTLTLENVAGFNAVNIFAIIPPEEMNRLGVQAAGLLQNKTQIVYVLEAESNLYNNKGIDTAFYHYLLDGNISKYDDNVNGKFSKTFTGRFKVPTNSNLVALELLGKENLSRESSYSIKDLEIVPASEKNNVFSSDFERNEGVTIPLATLRNFEWLNYDKGFVSTTLERNRPIYGNNSLKVDLKEGNRTGWNTISTDFIPLNENAYYNASLYISAKDVKQLHSKIVYFDSNKKEIRGVTDYIFNGRDGSFEDAYSSSILPPKGAKYLKFQILEMADNPRPSSYLLDKVRLDEIIIPDTSLGIKLVDSFKREDLKDQNLTTIINKDSLEKQIVQDNSTHYLVASKPFPVKENHIYNYKMTVEGENMSSLNARISFKNSDDVVENSNIYGPNASNGNVLSLGRGSELSTKLEILKPSNYTIALRVKTCETCTFLRMSIAPADDDISANTSIKNSIISLKGKDSELNWVLSNSTYLKPGKYEIRIYSDSKTDLDSLIIYSTNPDIDINDGDGSKIIDKKHNESVGELFRPGKNSIQAKIVEYKKINPTKHVLKIENATKPFMISFAESYNKLWTAHVDTSHYNNNQDNNKSRFKTNSVPLYGVINGFYVNKTGDYTLVIEYEPQIWFTQGLTIGTLSLGGILIALFLVRKKLILRLTCAIKRKIGA
jgi:hypothetical protein